MSYRDPRVLRLLEQMLDGKITEINPVLDPSAKLGFRYPAIDELLELPSEQTIPILESLAKDGVLEKKFFDKILYCPKCNSLNIRLSTHCFKCGSANIGKGIVLEHFPCGYVGPEEAFRAEAGYICPKCKKELKLIGTDYRNLGVRYKCQNCGEIFSEPTEKWHCLNCLEYFPKGESLEVNTYSYKFNEANRDKLMIELRPKRQIEEFLRRDNYDVKSSTKIRGTSGAEHEIDLYAVKKSGIFEHKIVVGISSSEKEVGQEEVLKLFAKAYDVGAKDIILIAIPKLSKDARDFANYYHMRTFEAEDLEKAIGQLAPKSQPLRGKIDVNPTLKARLKKMR